MAEQTPTTKVLNRLQAEGFTDTFLWDITHYAPKLLNDARNGHIEFIGVTQEKLEQLSAFCDKAKTEPKIFNAVSFLEHHHIHVEDNRYIRFGELLIANEIGYDEALEEYLDTDILVTADAVLGINGVIEDRLARSRESQRYIIAERNGNYRPISLKLSPA